MSDAKTNDISQPHYNVFRDSPLRYLGYANELGESFRYQVRPAMFCLKQSIDFQGLVYVSDLLSFFCENICELPEHC